MRSDVSAAATGCRAVDQVHSHQISSLDRRSQAEAGAMAEAGEETLNFIISLGPRSSGGQILRGPLHGRV